MKSLILVALLYSPVAAYCQSLNETRNAYSVTDKVFEDYCLKNAVSFMSISEEKRTSVMFAGNLPKLLPEGSTYKDYGVGLEENMTQYFTIAGTDKVLVVKSLYILRLNYSNSQK